MVKVFCDMCKREIDESIESVKLEFETLVFTQETDLCVSCATRVANWIKSQSENKED